MTKSNQDELAKRLLPKGDKEPMRQNAFELARIAGTTLTPAFPYLRAGDIVPAISVFQGRDDGNWGFFEHFNTVDEIVFSFGSSEGTYIRTGEITSGARTHGVTAPIADPSNTSTGTLVGVIQRQDEDETADQQESIIFRCSECNSELYAYSYAGRDNAQDGRPLSDDYFHTPYECDDAAKTFNEDENLRTCKNCGHINAPFPVDPWGWKRYREQTDFARDAKRQLLDAAQKAGRRSRRSSAA